MLIFAAYMNELKSAVVPQAPLQKGGRGEEKSWELRGESEFIALIGLTQYFPTSYGVIRA